MNNSYNTLFGAFKTLIIMVDKYLVVGYYDELKYTEEIGPYNPDWDVNSVAVWIEDNPEISTLDPDYNTKYRAREYALNKQWDLRSLKLKAKSKWSESRKRVFAVIEVRTPETQNELNYVTDHVNDIYVTINGKQEHVTDVSIFDNLGSWSAYYISIYENVEFLVKVNTCQADFALSLGMPIHELADGYRLNEPKHKLFDFTLRTSSLSDNRSPVYWREGDDYEPIYFDIPAHEYVNNTNFGPTVNPSSTNNIVRDDTNNIVRDYTTVNTLDKVTYPRNTDTQYKYEISNDIFDIPDQSLINYPLSDSLLETVGVSLRDTDYHWADRPLPTKILLSTRFNLVNLLILDSFQYMPNERYYITPNMKRYLLSGISSFDNKEIQETMNDYYRTIMRIIGVKGPINSEIESILRQHNEVSFDVLKHIMLVSRIHSSHISVMDSEIDNTLKTHEIEITNTLRNNNININNLSPHNRYVMYDKLLITNARTYMESLFLDLVLVLK